MNVPSFLVGVELSDADAKHYEDVASNWVKLHGVMSDMGEAELLKVLLFELKGRNRHDIVSRVRKRFEIVRSERENREMQALWDALESA